MAIGTVTYPGGALAKSGAFIGDVTNRVHHFDDFILGASGFSAAENSADGNTAGGTAVLVAGASADALGTTDEFIDISKPFACEFRVSANAITDAFSVGLADTAGTNLSLYGSVSGSAVTAYATNRNMIVIGTEFGSADGQLKIAENDGSGAPVAAPVSGYNVAAATMVRLGFYGDGSGDVVFTVDGKIALRYTLTETITGPLALVANVGEGSVTIDWWAATGERA